MADNKLENEIFHTKSEKCKNVFLDMKTGEIKIKSEFSCQTAKADGGKPIFSHVPKEIIYAIERVRAFGNKKYPEGGPNNWRRVSADRYWEAVLRHVLAAWDNYEKDDPESGLMHLEHIACNTAFILELIKERKSGQTDREPD